MLISPAWSSCEIWDVQRDRWKKAFISWRLLNHKNMPTYLQALTTDVGSGASVSEPCKWLATYPGCIPPLVRWKLGQAPAEPCDLTVDEQVRMDGWMVISWCKWRNGQLSLWCWHVFTSGFFKTSSCQTNWQKLAMRYSKQRNLLCEKLRWIKYIFKVMTYIYFPSSQPVHWPDKHNLHSPWQRSQSVLLSLSK